jgi:hypothetical protein
VEISVFVGVDTVCESLADVPSTIHFAVENSVATPWLQKSPSGRRSLDTSAFEALFIFSFSFGWDAQQCKAEDKINYRGESVLAPTPECT